jgi:hypothetical protein
MMFLLPLDVGTDRVDLRKPNRKCAMRRNGCRSLVENTTWRRILARDWATLAGCRVGARIQPFQG